MHRKSLKCLAASRDNPSLSRAITTHSKQRERNVVLVEAAVRGGGSALRDEPKQRLRRRLGVCLVISIPDTSPKIHPSTAINVVPYNLDSSPY